MVRRGGISQEHVPGVELQWVNRWVIRGALDGGRVEAEERRGGPEQAPDAAPLPQVVHPSGSSFSIDRMPNVGDVVQ